MSLRTSMATVALLLALAPGASAHSHEPPRHQQDHGRDDIAAPTWSELTPAQQEKLAPLREHWDQMPAPRRAHALERMERRAHWEALPPEQRERLRHGAKNFRDMPPELREKMRASMQAVRQLPEAERHELKQRWRAMDPQQRRRWLEAGGPGLAPPPPEG